MSIPKTNSNIITRLVGVVSFVGTRFTVGTHEGNEKEESSPSFSVMSRGSASKRAKSSAKHPTQQPAYEYYDDDSFIDEYSLVVSITHSEEDDYYGEKPKREKDKTKAPKKPKSRFAEWTPS